MIAVAAGGYHTCALLGTGGLKCWGDGRLGALGDGVFGVQGTPVDVLGLSSGVTAVVAGIYHTCALLDTGAVKCWGYNGYGQVGDGSADEFLFTPVDVVGLSSGVVAIAAGGIHTCALLDTGALKCWGCGRFGQLGIAGDYSDQKTPVDVEGLSNNVAAVFAGRYNTCVLLDTGTLKCWGRNNHGQLGNGHDDADQSRPVGVVGF